MSSNDEREFTAVAAAWSAERALRKEVMAPWSPREGADPVVARLEARAARAEQSLRTLATRQTPPVLVAPARGSRVRWLAAAAVLALASLVALFAWPRAAPVDPAVLGGELGGVPVVNILLDQHVSSASPEISWYAVPNARTYDVVILDAADRRVLTRPDTETRSTSWALTAAQIEDLHRAEAPLRMRVVARDGAGFAVGSTGDRLLRLSR